MSLVNRCMHKCRCEWSFGCAAIESQDEDVCINVAKNNHLDVLQWVRSQDRPCSYVPMFLDVRRYAAMGGHLDVLKWLPWGKYMH